MDQVWFGRSCRERSEIQEMNQSYQYPEKARRIKNVKMTLGDKKILPSLFHQERVSRGYRKIQIDKYMKAEGVSV